MVLLRWDLLTMEAAVTRLAICRSDAKCLQNARANEDLAYWLNFVNVSRSHLVVISVSIVGLLSKERIGIRSSKRWDFALNLGAVMGDAFFEH
jgi:hypothetical protein